MGLPAFKILGASWAVVNAVQQRLGITADDWSTLDELAEAGGVAATDDAGLRDRWQSRPGGGADGEAARLRRDHLGPA